MKITLPVAYEYEVRLLKSKVGKKEDGIACSLEEFELASYSSLDVHLVAEWRQSWKRDGRVTNHGLNTKSSGDFARDLASNRALARLVLIDGKFHAPMHYERTIFNKPIMAADLIDLMSEEKKTVFNIFGSTTEGTLWHFRTADLIDRSGFEREGEKALEAVLPETHLREITKNDLEANKAKIRTHLNRMAAVDGVIFVEVPEPCIAVEVNDKSVTMTLQVRRDDASDGTLYFPLTDYEAANDHFVANKEGKETVVRKVADLQVFIPEALNANHERDEFLRCARNMIDGVGDDLRRLPKEVGGRWYDLRDLYDQLHASSSEDDLDRLQEAVLNLAAEISNQSDISENVREQAEIGRQLTERWQQRPLGI